MVAGRSPAAAKTGDPLLAGKLTTLGGRTTELRNIMTGSSPTFLVTNNGSGSAVKGVGAQAAGGSFRTFGDGQGALLAQNDALSVGNGAAIKATGKKQKGIIATSAEHTAIEATAPRVGVHGSATDPAGYGVQGTGKTFGVLGETSQSLGNGVRGENNADTGIAVGVSGRSNSSTGRGVQGQGASFGVYGSTTTDTGYGVYSDGFLGTNLAIELPELTSILFNPQAGVARLFLVKNASNKQELRIQWASGIAVIATEP
jgi:hypothetical protein